MFDIPVKKETAGQITTVLRKGLIFRQREESERFLAFRLFFFKSSQGRDFRLNPHPSPLRYSPLTAALYAPSLSVFSFIGIEPDPPAFRPVFSEFSAITFHPISAATPRLTPSCGPTAFGYGLTHTSTLRETPPQKNPRIPSGMRGHPKLSYLLIVIEPNSQTEHNLHIRCRIQSRRRDRHRSPKPGGRHPDKAQERLRRS